jgi:hypothetical protein
MVAANAPRGPTPAEFETVLQNTNSYFTQYLKNFYANQAAVEVTKTITTLNNTAFNAGFPEARYNIYMDFRTAVAYSSSSFPDTPSRQFDILKDSINPEYIITQIRSIRGTPFQLVNEAFYAKAPDNAPVSK